MNSSRRRFLKHTGIAAAAATQLSWFSGSANAAFTDDYRALVCILLAGGADSNNILVPIDDARYASYAAGRADLALPQSSLLPLRQTGNYEYGVHPGMVEVQQLFDAGNLSFVANIGPLVQPTSRSQYDSASVPLPLGLFSHSDQIAVWQTAAAGSRINTGFGGRLADLVTREVPAGPVSMNISMSGTNLFQTGNQVASYAIDVNDGVRTLAGYAEADNQVFTRALDALVNQTYADPFRRTYADQLRQAMTTSNNLDAILSAAPAVNVPFSTGELSRALEQVAQLISVRTQLGATRQTFFITIGGWDHHDEVLNNQARMLPEISRGLGEFYAATQTLGLAENIVTFTISDFGRTLTSNGRGSDHGWGGHNLIMGAGVAGGTVFGQYPDLSLGSELDLGRGRFLPTTSIDEFYAELALWFGVPAENLSSVLPNISAFYDPQSMPLPLGMFV
ncbi:MAG: DUF1501 domain-containing protein [bacterium]